MASTTRNGTAPARNLTVEAGVAGNTGYWGFAATGEHLAKLEGASGRVIFEQMRRSDHQIRAVLSAITLPIRQADYYVEPASEEPVDVEIARVVGQNLLEGMTITWDDTVRHALLMLPFGFSVLEKVYEFREDLGLVLIRKLDPRLPQSVTGWEFDREKRRLRHIVQRDSDGAEYRLPIEKVLVFSTDREGDDWEGMSILRPAFKAFYIKDDLEKTNAIMHARWGAGIPKFKVPRGITRGTEEWEEGKQALEQVHANEKAYVMEPEGWEFSVVGGEQGEGTDVLGSIKYYDEAIAKAMLAMHINLGTSETGSRALGQSFIDAFLMATQTWGDYIAEVISRFCIRELVDLNWQVERYPVMRVKRIQGVDLNAIGLLAQSGIITHDRDLESSVREVLRLPVRKDDEDGADAAPPRQRPSQPMDAGEGDVDAV